MRGIYWGRLRRFATRWRETSKTEKRPKGRMLSEKAGHRFCWSWRRFSFSWAGRKAIIAFLTLSYVRSGNIGLDVNTLGQIGIDIHDWSRSTRPEDIYAYDFAMDEEMVNSNHPDFRYYAFSGR